MRQIAAMRYKSKYFKDSRYGNRHKYVYDGIIVHYMMKKQMHYIYKNFRLFLLMPVENPKRLNIPIKQSFTQLYRIIRATDKEKGGNPTVSKTTVQRHLNEMVKRHILDIYSRGMYRNQTLYGLSYETMTYYTHYLVKLKQRHRLNEDIFFGRYVR